MSWAALFSKEPTDSSKFFGPPPTAKRKKSKKTDGYESFLSTYFPEIATKALSERHHRLWRWFESLRQGIKPDAQIEVWPRGGAKSSTAELGVAYVGWLLSRRYVLYVSDTQDQADKHVQTIGELLSTLGIDRSLSKYGHSKGWRRNQLRTATGFNVEALGLDVAARGIKLDNFRPDLIVLDDIDNEDDTPKTTRKKTAAITSKIIPAGSSDCAVLGIQNLILESGFFGKLVSDEADYLYQRTVGPVEPAVRDLAVEIVDRGDGRKVYKIVGGDATWEGQNLATCEAQINEWGLRSFLRESQHEVSGADGIFFKTVNLKTIDELPEGKYKFCRAWDFAATEGAGDYTAGVLIAVCQSTGVVYVLEVFREQVSSENVRKAVISKAKEDRLKYGKVKIRLPQDPGQAGIDQEFTYHQILSDFSSDLSIKSPIKAKAKRAVGVQEQVNLGNVHMIRADWNRDFKTELKEFREDETHPYDDQVDALADSYNEIAIAFPEAEMF